jgi:hypothetical protein
LSWEANAMVVSVNLIRVGSTGAPVWTKNRLIRCALLTAS